MTIDDKDIKIEDLLKLRGSSEWKKDNFHRIYFNDFEWLFGLEITRYNTGNISYAKLNGKQISNSLAKKYLADIKFDSKFWYDVNLQVFKSKNIIQGDFDIFVSNIKYELTEGKKII